MRAILGGLAGLAIVLTVWAQETVPPTPAEAEGLIRQLGAKSFRERREAEARLKQGSRELLVLLEAQRESDDPEVRERVTRVIDFLMTSPAAIPSLRLAMPARPDVGSEDCKAEWNAALAKWRAEAKAAAANDEADGRGFMVSAGPFTQSFVPRAEKLAALELYARVDHNRSGWLMVELRPDRDTRPGPAILGRAWLYLPRNSLAREECRLLFDLPDAKVKADEPCWFVVQQFPDEGDSGAWCQFRATARNNYGEGQMLTLQRQPRVNNQDVVFRLYSEAPALPLCGPAVKAQLDRVPATVEPTDWAAAAPAPVRQALVE